MVIYAAMVHPCLRPVCLSLTLSSMFDTDDTPQTRRRKGRKRCTLANVSFTNSMKSPPQSSPRSSTPKLVQRDLVQQRQDPLPPLCQKSQHMAQVQNQNPSNTSICPGPENLIFCGLKPPYPCLNQLRLAQHRILPPYWPVYLPVGRPPCSQDCGSHYVHEDNLPILTPTSAHVTHPDLALPLLAVPPSTSLKHNYCSYEDCGCLRQYEGCDWAS